MARKIKRGAKLGDPRAPHGISPSDFMRELRPENYSDTEARASYVLTADAFEYRLETITARNETHDFELFCRKLCERTICPNLRPQTGPEGGGDSKADTETYPVADEISCRFYVGDANSGREKWAFAFSAKKRWSDKVRKDVKGLVETERAYDRIICVTSRFARAKDRSRIEDELSKKHGIPITIHDRSWIVREVIENDRADLAFNYLNVGASVADASKLGPKDYSRTQQLDDLERAIGDPDAYQGMELQLVTEALLAAKLSRGLERPRLETDGRFERAIRLADKHGTFRQKLETRYERVWTAFWWYNDFELLKSSYTDFEPRALKSNSAKNLEFLGNLHQLLVNSVIHDHMTYKECLLEERTDRLKSALELVAQDIDRPNNSLEAQAALLRITLNQAIMMNDPKVLPVIWQDFATIIERARGLGEFDADSLTRFIDVMGQIAGNDPAYNSLVETLAEFTGMRKNEGEGAVILLKRAQKLGVSDHQDKIRWLGKAVIGFTKREYTEQLIEATQLLALAYRCAGLIWAARASCVLAAASIIIEGEEDSDLSVDIVPTMKLWAWISFELGHLPDLLFAVQLLNGFLVGLPLTEGSKAKIRKDIQELDAALGCLFLNLEESELRRLQGVPDILEALGLFMARTALLYTLGHIDVLRGDGSLPTGVTDASAKQLLSKLKNQPVAESLSGRLILNGEGSQTLGTMILGMRVVLEIDSSESIVIAESILGSLEAFFATAVEHDVAPHVEVYRIVVSRSEEVHEPTIETSELDMMSTVMWPRGLSFPRFDKQRDVQEFFITVAAHVMGATCFVKDGETLLENLFTDHAVRQRMAIIAVAPNSYNRITSQSFSQLSDWQEVVQRSYLICDCRPQLPRATLNSKSEKSDGSAVGRDDTVEVWNHKGMAVRSVIDVHAWDQAAWKGCGYPQMGNSQPPCMAFLFENAVAARKIFERWRARFGEEDVNEEIAVSIIRHLPETNPHHYCVQVASRESSTEDDALKQPILMATRSKTMEPANSENLDMFLDSYKHFGAYYLLSAAISTSSYTSPDFFFDLTIMKRNLTVKSAADVGKHDLESLALCKHRQRVDS